ARRPFALRCMSLARFGCRCRSLSAACKLSLAVRARSKPASERPFDLSEAVPRPVSARPTELSEEEPMPRPTPVPEGGPPGEAPCPPAPRLLPWAAAVVALAVMNTIDTKIAPITKITLRPISLILLFRQSITATFEASLGRERAKQ